MTASRANRTTHLENEASGDIVVVKHITLGQDLLVPTREVLLLGDIDTDQSSALDLLLGSLGSGLLGLLLANSLVRGLLSLVGGLLGQLSSLLCGVLGDLSLGSIGIGGVLGAIRKGLGGGGLDRGRGVSGGLACHVERETTVAQTAEEDRIRREGEDKRKIWGGKRG